MSRVVTIRHILGRGRASFGSPHAWAQDTYDTQPALAMRLRNLSFGQLALLWVLLLVAMAPGYRYGTGAPMPTSAVGYPLMAVVLAGPPLLIVLYLVWYWRSGRAEKFRQWSLGAVGMGWVTVVGSYFLLRHTAAALDFCPPDALACGPNWTLYTIAGIWTTAPAFVAIFLASWSRFAEPPEERDGSRSQDL